MSVIGKKTLKPLCFVCQASVALPILPINQILSKISNIPYYFFKVNFFWLFLPENPMLKHSELAKRTYSAVLNFEITNSMNSEFDFSKRFSANVQIRNYFKNIMVIFM